MLSEMLRCAQHDSEGLRVTRPKLVACAFRLL